MTGLLTTQRIKKAKQAFNCVETKGRDQTKEKRRSRSAQIGYSPDFAGFREDEEVFSFVIISTFLIKISIFCCCLESSSFCSAMVAFASVSLWCIVDIGFIECI